MERLIAAFSLLLLVSCTSGKSADSDFTVISLAPSLTELIYFIHQEEHLVADTIYCDYPPQAQDLPKIGDMLTYDYEAVLALEPDLVIASYSGNSREGLERIAALGIETATLYENSVADIISNVTELGEIFDTDVSEYTAELSERLTAVAETTDGRNRTATLLLVSVDPYYSVTAQTFVGDVLTICGLSNVVRSEVAYPMLNAEDLIRLAPELVIYPDYTEAELGPLRDLLPNATYYSIDQDRISRPGPRIFDAMEELAGISLVISTNPITAQ